MSTETIETEDDFITIPMADYKDMQRDCAILEALRGHGVDNWEWYDDAMESVEGE